MARFRKKSDPTVPSTPPKKRRGGETLTQIRAIFTMTRRADPLTPWLMLLVFLVTMAAALGLGLWYGHPIYATIIGLPLALMAAMFVLSRKAQKAAYSQLDGQTGAAVAALSSLRRGWDVTQEPVALDPRTQDLVFRAVGRPGIVLVTEGPLPRVSRIAAAERKKVARILPNVPIHVLHAGDGEGQVALKDLTKRVTKLKGAKLSRQETAAVSKRLKALGGVRPPIPQGVDPMRARPDRRMSRGR